MIYLILKIFAYLLLAVIMGFGAGWLTRNILAQKREEELGRTVTEARARVPQFESLMRTRDEQVQRLRDELAERDGRLADMTDAVKSKEDELRAKSRELKTLTARNETLLDDDAEDYLGGNGDEPAGTVPAADNAESAQLREEVARLSRELEQAQAEAADALAEAAAAEAELNRLRAEAPADARPSATADVEELQARLRQQAEEQERLNRALDLEQRKVVELERERELQNKSLQVLHQQLELERERSELGAPSSAAGAEGATRH